MCKVLWTHRNIRKSKKIAIKHLVIYLLFWKAMLVCQSCIHLTMLLGGPRATHSIWKLTYLRMSKPIVIMQEAVIVSNLSKEHCCWEQLILLCGNELPNISLQNNVFLRNKCHLVTSHFSLVFPNHFQFLLFQERIYVRDVRKKEGWVPWYLRDTGSNPVSAEQTLCVSSDLK